MKELRLGSAGWRLRAVCAVFAGVAAAASVEARVTRIVIDSTTAVTGQALPYETLRGRAFGELDQYDAQTTEHTLDDDRSENCDCKVLHPGPVFEFQTQHDHRDRQHANDGSHQPVCVLIKDAADPF